MCLIFLFYWGINVTVFELVGNFFFLRKNFLLKRGKKFFWREVLFVLIHELFRQVSAPNSASILEYQKLGKKRILFSQGAFIRELQAVLIFKFWFED